VKRTIQPALAACITATGLIACAPDLGNGADDGDMGPSADAGGTEIEHEDDGDGVLLTRVDATSEDGWVYLSLTNGSQLDVGDAASDDRWGLGFRRFHIKLNGGDSGSAGVSALVLEDAAFDDVATAPAEGYVEDQPDGEDDNEDPDYVFADWYGYNIMTHVLTPQPWVYVVRTDDERYYRVQITDYYDDAGSSGYPSFRWSEIDAP